MNSKKAGGFSRAGFPQFAMPKISATLIGLIFGLRPPSFARSSAHHIKPCGSARLGGRRPFVVSRMQSLVPNGSLITAHIQIGLVPGGNVRSPEVLTISNSAGIVTIGGTQPRIITPMKQPKVLVLG